MLLCDVIIIGEWFYCRDQAGSEASMALEVIASGVPPQLGTRYMRRVLYFSTEYNNICPLGDQAGDSMRFSVAK